MMWHSHEGIDGKVDLLSGLVTWYVSLELRRKRGPEATG